MLMATIPVSKLCPNQIWRYAHYPNAAIVCEVYFMEILVNSRTLHPMLHLQNSSQKHACKFHFHGEFTSIPFTKLRKVLLVDKTLSVCWRIESALWK